MKDYPSRMMLNRDFSWLQYNDRILQEGDRAEVPLFERAKYIGISASNFDKFFQVRVASLSGLKKSKHKKKDVTGMTVEDRLKRIYRHARRFSKEQGKIYRRWLKDAKKAGVPELKIEKLSDKKRKRLEAYFMREIAPSLSPMMIKKRKVRFADGRLYILVCMKKGRIGMVQVPPLMDRMIDGEKAVAKAGDFLAEELIKYHLHRLFPGRRIKDAAVFRVTRSADFGTVMEKAGDLLMAIEPSSLKWKPGRMVRVEVEAGHPWALEYLREVTKVKKKAFVLSNCPLDLRFLTQWKNERQEKKGFFPNFTAVEKDWWKGDIFQAIRKKDRIHSLPYESYKPVVAFLEQASMDPRVVSIWQTLYRISEDSPIVEALRQAALRGKQVTIVVEECNWIDKESQIYWTHALEEAGCQVLYGHSLYKVHAKVLLIVRKEDAGLRSYLHTGTGNYNEESAKTDADFGVFTARQEMANDAMQLFNYLAGAIKAPKTTTLAIGPFKLREVLMEYISDTIRASKRGEAAWIFLKMNELGDEWLIQALYEASQAGVKIDCLVRGICCLRPGVTGISENIQVRSMQGRFLEHHRFFCFATMERERMILSSADWMPRNLDRQIELMVPIEDRDARERLKGWMLLQWQDQKNSYVLGKNGSYKPEKRGSNALDAQACLMGK